MLIQTCIFSFLFASSQAKLVRYSLNVSYFDGAPDGVETNILGINGQFPGPVLEANVGDILEITLINDIQDGQNTTIHWHGIDQHGYLFEDGTSMISQCPLSQGQSMTYKFEAKQSGTYWYHSHVHSQYTEGMFGPLLIHNTPEAYQYDGEFTLFLSDWYHQSAHENEAWYLSPAAHGIVPFPNSGLINGHGRYPCPFADKLNRTCNPEQQLRPVFKVEFDKHYRIRLINSAATSFFNFSIDGHTLDGIEVDGIDTTRVSAEIIPIAPGQRYSLLFECKNIGRHLIRADFKNESIFLDGENINKYPEALMADITAVVDCVDEDLSHLKYRVEEKTERFTYEDQVLPNNSSREAINEMALNPLDGISAPDYFDQEFLLEVTLFEDDKGVHLPSFNNSPIKFGNKPLLMELIDGEEPREESFPLDIEFGNVIQVVINNPSPGSDPLHLHGYHFWILGLGKMGDGDYDTDKHNLTINGVKRDTVDIPSASWAVIRFVADNPGIWIFHCHIDWHVLAGMAVTFVDGKDIVRNNTVVTDEALRVCRLHDI